VSLFRGLLGVFRVDNQGRTLLRKVPSYSQTRLLHGMAYRAEPAAHERDRANEATGESVRLSFMTTNENEEKSQSVSETHPRPYRRSQEEGASGIPYWADTLEFERDASCSIVEP
jgi:hypothetical protein